MFLFHKIGFIRAIIILSVVFAETIAQLTSTERNSNSSSVVSSSNFNEVKLQKTFTEYVREHNVHQRWKSMETTFIKILTAMYNETLPIMSQITKDLDISSNCKTDLMDFLTGIKEFKYWAIQMLDSFGKIPSGIEKGTVSAFGDFDQCLDVDVPGRFQGQYCNLDLILPLPKRQPFLTSHTEVQEVMDAIKSDGYFTFFARFGRMFYSINPRTSICVPSTCSKNELQKIASKAVQIMDLSFGLRIPNCEVLDKEIKFDSIEISLMIILAVLISFATTATAVDVYLNSVSKKEGHSYNCTSLSVKYLLCFSFYSNAKKLFKHEAASMQIFEGLRVLSTLWTILAHSCIFLDFGTTGAALTLYFYGQKLFFQIVVNSYSTVETFFFMSGVLHAITILKTKEKINVKKIILRRIWRLTPPFMLVIACVILSPHVGSGPIWQEIVGGLLADKCRAQWWTNLLFINNFIPMYDQCLLWFWYIPAHFHLYVLSFIALIPMKSNPSRGLLINFSIMIGAMIISAAFHVHDNLTPCFMTAFTHPEDISYYVDRAYLRTYIHCTSVCIGVAVGYYLVNRAKKQHIPWKVSAPLWLASLAGPLACILGSYQWAGGQVPGIGVSVLYAIGRQVVFSLAMAWLIIACMTGNGGTVTKFLSLPIFVPLGRLCYMTYLIHPVIHYMYLGSNRMHLYFDLKTIGYMYCGTVFISFMCAIPLTLLFESPFVALDKLVFAQNPQEKAERSKILEREKSERESVKTEDIAKDIKSDKKVD